MQPQTLCIAGAFSSCDTCPYIPEVVSFVQLLPVADPVLFADIQKHRAVGWHLLSAQERAAMDASQWKSHAEELEAAATAKEQEWAQNQQRLDAQVQDIKVWICNHHA